MKTIVDQVLELQDMISLNFELKAHYEEQIKEALLKLTSAPTENTSNWYEEEWALYQDKIIKEAIVVLNRPL